MQKMLMSKKYYSRWQSYYKRKIQYIKIKYIGLVWGPKIFLAWVVQRTLLFRRCVIIWILLILPGHLLFGLVAKTGNIPLLASWGEITSFPPGQFVCTKVVGIYSLCPTYWEATPESCPCTTWRNVAPARCFKMELLQLIRQIIIYIMNSQRRLIITLQFIHHLVE